MSHAIIHFGFHLLISLGVARVLFKERWWQAWLVMILAMVVDLDHLLANPCLQPLSLQS